MGVELPNARLLTVEGAAHQIWVDAPDVVLGAIDTFRRGEWPSGRSASPHWIRAPGDETVRISSAAARRP